MEVLELKPVKDKQIFVFLIKKEDENLTYDESLILTDILQKYNFKFATIVLKDEELKTFANFLQTSLAIFLNDFLLPCFIVDIPDYAKGYLYSEISEEKEQIMELESEYKTSDNKSSFKAENLKLWIEYLKEIVHEKEVYFKTKLKSQWIVKKILDFVRYYEENIIYILHFTPESLIMGLKETLEDLKISVVVGEIQPTFLTSFQFAKNMEVN